MHFIEIVDSAHEQQLLVDPGIVTQYASRQGAAEGAPGRSCNQPGPFRCSAGPVLPGHIVA
jgi:hypothetical protein